MNLSPDGFGLHTFQLTKSISNPEYQKIKDAIFNAARESGRRAFKVSGTTVIKCEVWSDSGITVFLHGNADNLPHLRIVVNPRLILDDNEYVGIFQYTETDTTHVFTFIESALTQLNISYGIEDLTLSRIDLCVNVESADPTFSEDYMRLIRKCAIPATYKRDCFSSDEANYIAKNKRSFRAEKKSVCFTVYDKIFQLNERNHLQSNRKLPASMLRFEVALKRTAILRISEKSYSPNMLSNAKLLQHFGTNCRDIMENYIREFFPNGVYLKYDDLKNAIINLNAQTKIIHRMLYLMEKASECHNLNNALNMLKKHFGLDDEKCRDVLKQFHRYKINPISLPNAGITIAMEGILAHLGYELPLLPLMN